MSALNKKTPKSRVRLVKKPAVVAAPTSQTFTPTSPSRQPNAVSAAGAPAYTASDKWALLALLTTSFNEGSFYESSVAERGRLKDLVRKYPKFAAQAAIFVRNNLGNRSITQAAMVEVANAPEAKGQPWLSASFQQFCRRPDDITNILAGQLASYGKPFPNGMRRGLKKAFGKFDGYQLAKYRSEDSAVKLVDAVNILHPTPNETNRDAIAALVGGTLRNAETWETLMSEAGDSIIAKSKVWRKLLVEGKLGIMALVKNLRNIANVCEPGTVELAAETLVNPEALRKGLVLPFRLVTAYHELKSLPGENIQRLVRALRDAVELTVANLPKLEGRLAVFLDTSGSMGNPTTPKTPAQTGTMFAAALKRANPEADIFMYSNSAKMFQPRGKTCMEMQEELASEVEGGGTSLASAYIEAAARVRKTGKQYDAIVILSDEGTWIGAQSGATAHRNYCRDTGGRPKVFTFDLKHTGTCQFPEEDVFSLSGFSEKLLPLINMHLRSKSAFIDMVEAAVPL